MWKYHYGNVLEKLNLQTLPIRHRHYDILFLINVFIGTKCWPSVLETVGLRVPAWNIRSLIMFSCAFSHWPSFWCVSAANAVCKCHVSRVPRGITTGSGLDDWVYWHLIQWTRTCKQYSATADLHSLRFTVAHAIGFSVSTSRILATDLYTGTITSNHYEVFLSFLIQSPWTAHYPRTRPNSPILSVQSNPVEVKKSKLLYDWQFTANQFVLSSSPLRPRT
jgi:hypothetical protein